MIFLGVLLLIVGGVFTGQKIVEVISVTENWNKWDALFKQYGRQWGVDWKWLKAIALNESNLGAAPSVARGLASPSDVENSKSSDGKSWGLMQLTMPTARALSPGITEKDLNNPEISIGLAAKLVGSDIMPQFSTSDPRFLEYVIKSYNQGWPNTKKFDVKGVKGPWSDHVQSYWERFQRNLKRVQGE